MKLAAYFSRAGAIPIPNAIANWDWRVARLISAIVFCGAAFVQVEWARESTVKAISFYYSIGATACLFCAAAYWRLAWQEFDKWSIERRLRRFCIQFAGCIVWVWTSFLDVYAHIANIIVMDATSWKHHLIINGVVIVFLTCSCANEAVLLARAMAYHEEDDASCCAGAIISIGLLGRRGKRGGR